MSMRTVLVSATLLALCGAVSSQPQIPPPSVNPPGTPAGVAPHPALPPLPGAPSPAPGVVPPAPRLDFFPPAPSTGPSPAFAVPVAPPVPVKPTPPPEPTVEDLLTALERVQAEKAALDKKEQELKTTVRKKLEQQAERLNKLGVTPKDAKEADRVGRIIIEGNAAKDEKKILDAMGMRPGQVLQYPVLEAARTKLEKAGFKSVTVEVLPGELDATFKDIRVRVGEPKPEPPLPPLPITPG